MVSSLIGVAVCCAPLLLVWLGYLWGRYGLPVELRRRRVIDRRNPTPIAPDPAGDSSAIEVYRYDASN